MLTDYRGDLFELDLSTMVWKDLTLLVSGARPTPRARAGFTSLNKNIYLIGGMDTAGTYNGNGAAESVVNVLIS